MVQCFRHRVRHGRWSSHLRSQGHGEDALSCFAGVSKVTLLPCSCIYKWKNHFYKMKGDVGMSGHEKERKQEDAYTKIQTHS